ncbi:MAG: PBP1A family penicillin-binding protein [Roseibium sp.]|uniref:transglycosylase domain-containing protein n=1 Tax=Roseibium sp. TaxID=1936156 RepID=UPI001B014513|nr:PBP1A family penicillin-binding protein [Roseibium sp.]MBO6893642.1 PBP1A family penicillin-binding protein [Roseibium sp.]MBO6928137.1 PBP1A family penicillin-binding protein [Roseibium sp.]
MANDPLSKNEDRIPKPRLLDRIRRFFLGIDAFVDTALWKTGTALRRIIEGYDAYLRRFRAKGIWRGLSELASDGLTFGLIGFVVVLAFAQPAFEATRYSDWKTTDDFAVTFLDRFGKEIGRRGIVLNDSVPLEEIPDSLVKATLATEDRRFFYHFGIDFVGTFRAMVENARAGGVVQGGSTLTQQLAKNLFLTNERSLSRKIKEAYLALWLEANLSKQEILKLYLDRAYMGGGVFGVTAAAEFYFNKNVRELTLAESAMLAGLYKAPTKFAPHINLPAARARANEVLTNMVQAELLTEGQVIGARRNPALAVDRSQEQLPEYFLDWALDEVKKLARRNPALAKDRIVTVRTTLDPALQRQADLAVETILRENGKLRDANSAALVSMVPDGAVVAMVGGRSYGESQFNRAVNALRQPGSSFKPFVYITAFMNGYGPDSIVSDRPVWIGNWSPKNYTRSYRGPVSLKLALTKSINTIPVRLSIDFGREKIIETAYAMGLTHELENSISLPIGSSEVSVIDMAASYATFANGGYKAPAYAILEVKNSDGKVLYRREQDEPDRIRVLPEDKVFEMNDILVNVVEAGTARRARIDGVVAAGKTGTTNAYRDAWFVGYTGNFSTAVWFGNDDFTSTRRVTGGSLPAMTWQKYMAFAHNGIELVNMPGVAAENLPRLARAQTTTLAESTATSSQPRVLKRRTQRLLLQIGEDLRQLVAQEATRADNTTVPSSNDYAAAQ